MRTISPAHAPSPPPAYKHPSPAIQPPTTQPLVQSQPSNSTTINFSPPLIAMVVTVATAFLLITYSRLISRHILRRYRIWRRHRRRRHYLPSSNGDPLDSPPPLFDSPDGFHVYSPYGLDESVIKTIPLSLYNTKNDVVKDCAVCLLEFEVDDYVRTLPVCCHVFHVDCIDIWLRSHPNCPLCRAGIFRHQDSPFVPVMASRIRPTLDDVVDIDLTHYSNNLIHTSDHNSRNLIHTHHNNDEDSNVEPLIQTTAPSSHANVITSVSSATEITPCVEGASPRRNSSNFNSVHYLDDRSLKRSYSFGFERGVASERMLVLEAATASPWRYRRGSFWSKRPSPFSSISKPRAFSFRYYRGIKSPFFRRRTSSFFPLSERFAAVSGGSSRRSKSMASPMFLRSSVAAFSSSRLRCGDPEALLSPDRFNRR